MNASVKFHQKPMGLGTLIGFLILTVQYVGLAFVVWIILNGHSGVDPIASVGEAITTLIDKVSASWPAGH